jgi:hypothetical protein
MAEAGPESVVAGQLSAKILTILYDGELNSSSGVHPSG